MTKKDATAEHLMEDGTEANVLQTTVPKDADVETGVFTSLDAACGTYTDDRDKSGLSSAVVRGEWVAAGHNFSKADVAKAQFHVVGEKVDPKDPMQGQRDTERYERIAPLDVACMETAKLRLAFHLDVWKSEVFTDGETCLCMIPCVAFDGMPTQAGQKAGSCAMMLTKLVEEEQIAERTREGVLTGATVKVPKTTHRLHFVAREHDASFEGEESFHVPSKERVSETELKGAYLSQHKAKVTYAVFTIEGNIFHVHSEALDLAKLVLSWAGGNSADTIKNCSKWLCYEFGSSTWGPERSERHDNLRKLIQTLETHDQTIKFDLHSVFPKLDTAKLVSADAKEGRLTETYYAIYIAFRDPSTLDIKTMVAYAEPACNFKEIMGFVSKVQRLTATVDFTDRDKDLKHITSKPPVHVDFSSLASNFDHHFQRIRTGLVGSAVVSFILAIHFAKALSGRAMAPSIILQVITFIYKGIAASRCYKLPKLTELKVDLYMSWFAFLTCIINIIIAAVSRHVGDELGASLMTIIAFGQGLAFRYSRTLLNKIMKDDDKFSPYDDSSSWLGLSRKFRL